MCLCVIYHRYNIWRKWCVLIFCTLSIDANERIKVAILHENLIKLLKYYKFIELYHRFITSWIFFTICLYRYILNVCVLFRVTLIFQTSPYILLPYILCLSMIVRRYVHTYVLKRVEWMIFICICVFIFFF